MEPGRESLPEHLGPQAIRSSRGLLSSLVAVMLWWQGIEATLANYAIGALD